ncbi:MAG: molybdate ABC transporter permease subunit [Clostridium sp.]|jgi:molybdate transport system permease protein|nr:molybdate ABC transporter permease subunit [Clostridium sp.]
MDWYPLWNSLRIAAVSSVLVFFSGIAAAYYAARLPKLLKGILDVILTLPMVLPPTVVGYFLLLSVGSRRPLGIALEALGLRLVMDWRGGILAAFTVSFPLMYRTARGAFESFDETLAQAGKTLGLSNTFIFWHIRMPVCSQGILAGAVLAFARALGEYGATSMLIGYTPGRTATISTTVYQMWRTGNDRQAFLWVCINLAISAAVLLAVNSLEKKGRIKKGGQSVADCSN